ncbi:hypothetical protein [Caballeronia sp. LZ035]|uniref:hypothetical protein n=1 Tax=Caballeronia sp. LZ035 TaxID=3038568 RepID=UPI0028633C98|nr:hypothetical protein [Caballeronia sp. LZ035]MDR5757042.1 hypothetical protein [Caballeronia sp. LZ035]
MNMRATIIFCALAVSGCATTPAPAPSVKIIDTACDWVRPIAASTADTLDTKRQILALDLAIIKNCPVKKN